MFWPCLTIASFVSTYIPTLTGYKPVLYTLGLQSRAAFQIHQINCFRSAFMLSLFEKKFILRQHKAVVELRYSSMVLQLLISFTSFTRLLLSLNDLEKQ